MFTFDYRVPVGRSHTPVSDQIAASATVTRDAWNVKAMKR